MYDIVNRIDLAKTLSVNYFTAYMTHDCLIDFLTHGTQMKIFTDNTKPNQLCRLLHPINDSGVPYLMTASLYVGNMAYSEFGILFNLADNNNGDVVLFR